MSIVFLYIIFGFFGSFPQFVLWRSGLRTLRVSGNIDSLSA